MTFIWLDGQYREVEFGTVLVGLRIHNTRPHTVMIHQLELVAGRARIPKVSRYVYQRLVNVVTHNIVIVPRGK